MSIADTVTVIVGLATMFFLWQQNQIFREQNEIFAKQAGGTVSSLASPAPITGLKRYWPMLAMATLAVLTWLAVGYDVYDRHSTDLSKFRNDKITATVYGKRFHNEKVEVDSKRFEKCFFENVTFVIRGTGPVQMTDVVITGSKWVDLEGDAVSEVGFVLAALHMVDPTKTFKSDSQGNETPAIRTYK